MSSATPTLDTHDWLARRPALHILCAEQFRRRPERLGADALQGVDNIEVHTPRLRLFELWLDQSFAGGHASLRGGLYNLNSEFYSNEAAGRLLAPPFGIGSELAATGPNGPSIFPSTALGLRLNVSLAKSAYARVAVLNAHSGVIGDPKRRRFHASTTVFWRIAEAGVDAGPGSASGAWRYSRKAGRHPRRRWHRAIQGWWPRDGAYLPGPAAGCSAPSRRAPGGRLPEGWNLRTPRTTPFRGGWQAGVHIARPRSSTG